MGSEVVIINNTNTQTQTAQMKDKKQNVHLNEIIFRFLNSFEKERKRKREMVKVHVKKNNK